MRFFFGGASSLINFECFYCARNSGSEDYLFSITGIFGGSIGLSGYSLSKMSEDEISVLMPLIFTLVSIALAYVEV